MEIVKIVLLTYFLSWFSMVTKYGIEMRLKKKYEQDLNMYKEGKIA